MFFEDFRDNHGSLTLDVDMGDLDPCCVLMALETEYDSSDFNGTLDQFIADSITCNQTRIKTHPQTRRNTDMSFQIEDISEIEPAVLELIGFSLAGKISGKIVGTSMSMASAQALSERTIDSFREDEIALREREVMDDMTDKMGHEAAQKPAEVLAAWIGCRDLLIQAGQNAKPLSDSFAWTLQQAAIKHTDESQIEELSKASGMSKAELLKEYAKKHETNYARTKDIVFRATDIVAETVSNVSVTPPGLRDMIAASILSGRKSAVRMSNSIEEAVASNILLEEFENTI